MILIFDVIVWFLLGKYLEKKEVIHGKISFLLAIYFFIILKSILLGIFLGLFNLYFANIIITSSIIINIFFLGFFFFKKEIFGKSDFKINFKPKINDIIFRIFVIITSILIYNTIPFGGDELMYHMPISVELLQKWSWMSDLGLSYYWHNNIWQWYPKNLYFIIDYFFVNFPTIIGIQIFSIFSFLFFTLALLKFFTFFYKEDKIENKNLIYLTTTVALTIPVTFLNFFVKWDVILMGILILFIYNLLIFKNPYFLSILFVLILGLKITGIFLAGVIGISYLIFSFIKDKKSLWNNIKSLFNKKFIIFTIIIFTIGLYSYIFNFIKFDNFLYPINRIQTDDTIAKDWTLQFSAIHYFKDLIYSSVSNWPSMKNLENTGFTDGIYNYDRWLGIMGFFMILGICIFFCLTKKWNKLNLFIIILLFTFFLLSLSKTSILFGHRYQIFIYSLLVWITCYYLYQFFKNKSFFIFWVIIFINIFLSYKNIWIYGLPWSWLSQLQYFTTSNYCEKITKIWDLTRDYYVNGWKYICENTKNKNILLVNQTFNLYDYWKNFDNKLYNNVFQNKNDFKKFLEEKSIDYIITSNKNNLYGKYGIENNSFYTDTFSANDETILFCSDKLNNTKISKIELWYKINRPNDIKVEFGINDLSQTITLDWERSEIDTKNTEIKNICLSIFNKPEIFDNKFKIIDFSDIIAHSEEWKKIHLTWKEFKFKNFAIEDKWLESLGYQKVLTDNFKDFDFMYIWKKQ